MLTVVAIAAGFAGLMLTGFDVRPTSGFAGIGLAGVFALLGIVILSPWKRRPLADWMLAWLASTVFRILATPVAALLLYSAASSGAGGESGGVVLEARAFGLSIAVTYLATLFVEAGVLSGQLKALLPAVPKGGMTGSPNSVQASVQAHERSS